MIAQKSDGLGTTCDIGCGIEAGEMQVHMFGCPNLSVNRVLMSVNALEDLKNSFTREHSAADSRLGHDDSDGTRRCCPPIVTTSPGVVTSFRAQSL